jgi:hypothetical protein
MKTITKELFGKIILVIGIVAFAIPAHSQAPEDSLKNFFLDLSRQYLTEGALSYNIHYTYSNESTPEKILDSLTTKLIIHGKNYYYAADSTEIFTNDSISIAVFNDNKILYITKARSFDSYNPVALLDSFFRTQRKSFAISEQEDEKTVQIFFPDWTPYKRISITVDKHTGLLTSMEYLVKTEELMESGVSTDNVGQYDKYALVKARLEKDETPDSTLGNFNPTEFFYRVGNQIMGAGKYKDYMIYKGSVNM